jgi:hypothetical protein
MILIKEITIENCKQFRGLPANVMVVEHKRGDMQMKHSFYLIGIIVCEPHHPLMREKNEWGFYIQFTNGDKSGFYNSVTELMEDQQVIYSFYYIEIKKQQ